MSQEQPISILSNEVACKIAAGEVIDRPCAVVRELMDNSVDSKANLITVELVGGGNTIRVTDNGCGMTKDDLLMCATPHCTSKIKSTNDLLHISTLGFRGEALASIATVSNLTIDTANYSVKINGNLTRKVNSHSYTTGTIMCVQGLFDKFPARKVFLKRAATENGLCRQTFIEKALPCPNIAFKLFIDGVLKLNLKGGVSLLQRFVQAIYPDKDEALFTQLNSPNNENWSFKIIMADPCLSRKDRKDMYVYVNGRRVTEFSLLQAIESGITGYFPNGTHPIAVLFAQVNPMLVDFNIHPAKKEIRFKNVQGLHHAIVTTIATFLKNHCKTPIEISQDTTDIVELAFNESKTAPAMPQTVFPVRHISFKEEKFPTSLYDYEPMSIGTQGDEIEYIGQCFGTFLIVQKEQLIYFIDLHAAHERLRFNKIMEESNENCQKLLVPYIIQTQDSNDDTYLESMKNVLNSAGYKIENCGNGKWEVSSVPLLWRGTQSDLQKDLLSRYSKPQDLIYNLAATAACRGAVKNGDRLDYIFATKLATLALNLPDPHCPHGRPIWTTVSKKQLCDLVKRT